MGAGRPTEYNLELSTEICELIANGMNILAALQTQPHYPSWSTFRRWKRDVEELRTLYVNAVQDKSEAVLFEIDEITDGCKNGDYEPSVANVCIQTLKWKAAKFYPKMFGDQTKVQHSSDPDNPIKSIPLVLSDGRSYEDLKDELKPE